MKSKVDEISCGCMDVTASKSLQRDIVYTGTSYTLQIGRRINTLSPADFLGERSLFVTLKVHIEYIVEGSCNPSTDTIADELLKSRQTLH